MSELLQQPQSTQGDLDPRFKALRAANSALQQAIRLASQEKADALPMQKALVKLEQALSLMQEQDLRRESMEAAVESFAAQTNHALDALAFEFAKDLKESFEARGETVGGRPPTLVVNELVLQIDINGRKAQWFYGKEALTRPLALSLGAITKAYDQQYKRIMGRTIPVAEFLGELYGAWKQLIDERSRRPQGGRINIVEVYSKLVLNRQNKRFWNQPSRSTFRDYEREFFVRDLVLAREADPVVTVEGQTHRLRLGVATKSQAENASRSVWIPTTPLDGEYYSDITFDE